MNVILLQDVEKLGLRGEVVSVARGYARNFLLPRKLAETATPARVAELHKLEERHARHEAKTADDARAVAERLSSVELRFDVKAGPTGSLFGSVTPTNIADALWEDHKIRIDRRRIGLDTIKRIGRYDVPIDLVEGVSGSVRTLVVPEGGELPPDEELEAMAAAERAEQQQEAEPRETFDLAALEAAEAEAAAERAEAEGNAIADATEGHAPEGAVAAEPAAEPTDAA